jgi:hypothetical protein
MENRGPGSEQRKGEETQDVDRQVGKEEQRIGGREDT